MADIDKEYRQRMRTWMGRIVGVPDIHLLINDVFDLGRRSVSTNAPAMWVSRSRARGGDGAARDSYITNPIPESLFTSYGYVEGGYDATTNRRRDFWYGYQIIEWYAEWKQLTIPRWLRNSIDKAAGR